jgi:hypothetical protein
VPSVVLWEQSTAVMRGRRDYGANAEIATDGRNGRYHSAVVSWKPAMEWRRRANG